MKLTVFIALFFALAMSPLSAGSKGDGHERHGQKHHRDRGPRDPVAHMTEALSLSEDQAAQIEAIFTAQRQEYEAMRDAQQEDRCGKRAAVETQIVAVLTDEQAAQFAEMKTERTAKMAERVEKMAERAEKMAERGDGDGQHKRMRHHGSPMGDC